MLTLVFIIGAIVAGANVYIQISFLIIAHSVKEDFSLSVLWVIT